MKHSLPINLEHRTHTYTNDIETAKVEAPIFLDNEKEKTASNTNRISTVTINNRNKKMIMQLLYAGNVCLVLSLFIHSKYTGWFLKER